MVGPVEPFVGIELTLTPEFLRGPALSCFPATQLDTIELNHFALQCGIQGLLDRPLRSNVRQLPVSVTGRWPIRRAVRSCRRHLSRVTRFLPLCGYGTYGSHRQWLM